MNAAITNTMAEQIAELGGIPAQRIQIEPAPGTATVEDLARYNETHVIVLTLSGESYHEIGSFKPGQIAESKLLPDWSVDVQQLFNAASAP